MSRWKKALGETQTLCTGSSKVEPKIFALLQTPFTEVRGGQNLVSWRSSLPLPTNPVWWGSMHAIPSYRGNGPTNRQTQPQTHPQTGPITIHCTAKLSVQCKMSTAECLFSFKFFADCLSWHTDLCLRRCRMGRKALMAVVCLSVSVCLYRALPLSPEWKQADSWQEGSQWHRWSLTPFRG